MVGTCPWGDVCSSHLFRACGVRGGELAHDGVKFMPPTTGR